MIVRLSRTGAAERLRLFCFPYAGGTAASFRSWVEHVPADIGLYSFEVPGRARRFNEPALAPLAVLTRALVDAVRGHLSLPFVFFGHSLGARVAFAVAERLRAGGLPLPLLLVVSASLPPDRAPDRVVSSMSDAEFHAYLSELGGTPSEALADRELMDLLIPMLRSDFELACELVPPSGLLECPILAFAGADDEEISPDDLDGWRRATRGPLFRHVLPGGHFFLAGAERTIIDRTLAMCQIILSNAGRRRGAGGSE